MSTKQVNLKSGVISVVIVSLIVCFGGIKTVLAAAPSNDNMASATVVASLPYTDSVDTTEAALEGSEPAYVCGEEVGATVWYSYTPVSTGDVFINTQGSNFSCNSCI